MPNEPRERDDRPFDGRLTLIGQPASKRIAALREAGRRYDATVAVVSCLDAFSGRAAAPPRGSLVRIESPGECDATTRAILKAGIEPLASLGGAPLTASEIDERPVGRGEILSPRQWFLGYRALLADLESRWAERDVAWSTRPGEIVAAFDKLATLERWRDAVLPVPPRHENVACYDELRARVNERHARVFVKLRYGYSAMGAVAFERRGALVRAITTVETTHEAGRPRLFVSKRPRVLRDEREIAWLIDSLGREEIVAEDWLPKARWKNKSFDLRLVTIRGRLRHAVGRASSSPFTNLNLDAERIAREAVETRLGESWGAVESLAARAAACFPEASVLGLDLLVRPCRARFALLEANAFGDYLPGLLHEGLTTHEAFFAALHATRRATSGAGV